MALSSLIVRIGADVSELNRGVGQAERVVDQFGKKMATTGRSVARMGNRVTIAAGSLQRMAGVIPGVNSKTVSMISVLGTAGMVLGETAVLSTALTKAWRLLTVASLHLASALPAALAPLLGNPITLAILGVAALTAGFIGLKSAIDGARKAKAGTMDPNSEFFMTPGAFKEKFFKDIATGDANRTLGKAADLASPVIEAWRQAVSGIRPLTDKMVEDWDAAQSAIAEAFTHSRNLTRAQINDLYELRAALNSVFPRTGPAALSIGDAAGQINVGGLPSTRKTTGQALDPRSFLGGQMDFRPTESKPSMWQKGKSAMGDFGGDALKMITGAFNPLVAVMPVITGIFKALAPILEPLVPIFESLGQIIGVLLAPIIKQVAVALSFLAEALGWTIRAIGRLIDAIPGVSAKGLINSGQAMIDAARAARRNASATDKATDAVNDFAASLSNIPRVLNINALRHLVGAGSGTGPGTSGTPPRRGGKDDRETRSSFGDTTINVYGATDPVRTAEAIGRELQRRQGRGGTSRIAVALA